MKPNLLGLLCTVRGLLPADPGGLYFGLLALFNTITTAPFCPDLLPFYSYAWVALWAAKFPLAFRAERVNSFKEGSWRQSWASVRNARMLTLECNTKEDGCFKRMPFLWENSTTEAYSSGIESSYISECCCKAISWWGKVVGVDFKFILPRL